MIYLHVKVKKGRLLSSMGVKLCTYIDNLKMQFYTGNIEVLELEKLEELYYTEQYISILNSDLCIRQSIFNIKGRFMPPLRRICSVLLQIKKSRPIWKTFDCFMIRASLLKLQRRYTKTLFMYATSRQSINFQDVYDLSIQ